MIKRYQREILYAVFAAITAFCIFCIFFDNKFSLHDDSVSAHIWLHQHASLTADQDKNLTAIEKRFGEHQKVLEDEIRAANRELAAAMLQDKKFSDRVATAVEHIHHAQGELQKETVAHIFEMQTVLTPQQADALNKFAADALLQNP